MRGSLRSDTRAPPALGVPTSRSGPATASGEPRGQSRAGAYITAGGVRPSPQVDEGSDSAGHPTVPLTRLRAPKATGVSLRPHSPAAAESASPLTSDSAGGA